MKKLSLILIFCLWLALFVCCTVVVVLRPDLAFGAVWTSVAAALLLLLVTPLFLGYGPDIQQ